MTMQVGEGFIVQCLIHEIERLRAELVAGCDERDALVKVIADLVAALKDARVQVECIPIHDAVAK